MPTSPTTILVVDDDQGFRRFTTSLLERAGYTPVEASTGEEAVEAAQKERPALVLLDVKLPGISVGFVALAMLQAIYGVSASVL